MPSRAPALSGLDVGNRGWEGGTGGEKKGDAQEPREESFQKSEWPVVGRGQEVGTVKLAFGNLCQFFAGGCADQEGG